MRTDDHRTWMGSQAEQRAVEHLTRSGYRIRDRNVPCRVGELDIVAQKGSELVIVEVRMKSSDATGEPSETVSYRKQRRIALATSYYLQQERLDVAVRFDVIAVVGRGPLARIEHIEDAFEAGF